VAEYAYKEFLEVIHQRKYGPVILFTGAEDFLIDEGVHAIVEQCLDPSARSFNLDVMDGTSVDARDVVSHASSFPMMNEKRVVIVKDFDKLIGNEASQKTITAYLAKPLESTVLVLTSEKVDGRKRPVAEIKKHFASVVCKPLWENQLAPWAAARFKKKGKTADAEACELLATYVGSSLRAIDNEIDKVIIAVGNRSTVTMEDIAGVVGASRGYTVFDLQDAIGERNIDRALTILAKMLDYGESPVMIIAMLTRFVIGLHKALELRSERMTSEAAASKMKANPYVVKKLMAHCVHFSFDELDRSMRALLATDIQLKSSGLDPRVAVELLVHAMASRAPATK
jgi:DNA polymerase-3 subunit delta